MEECPKNIVAYLHMIIKALSHKFYPYFILTGQVFSQRFTCTGSRNLTLICYLPGQVGEQIPHFLSIYFPYLSTFVEHQLPPASSSLTQLLCFTPAQIKGKTHGWSGSYFLGTLLWFVIYLDKWANKFPIFYQYIFHICLLLLNTNYHQHHRHWRSCCVLHPPK